LAGVYQLRHLFTEVLDLCAIPARYFFEVLANFATNDQHREKLEEFSSSSLEGKDALYEYCKFERRTCSEVLWDFFSARPPLEVLVNIIPRHCPRRYSIASAPAHPDADAGWFAQYLRATPCSNPVARALPEAAAAVVAQEAAQTLELCVAVVQYKTRLQREIEGVCSAYLRGMEVGAPVRVEIERGSLTLPEDDVPLIMICPGTGLSPCRSLVQERHRRVRGTSRGFRDLMFLGFRNHEKDYLFGEEWAAYSDWLDVHVAFSRDAASNATPYVQHKLEEHGRAVGELILKGARVYVCGRAHPMPAQVFDALVKCLCTQDGFTEEAATQHLQKMQRSSAYINDTWG